MALAKVKSLTMIPLSIATVLLSLLVSSEDANAATLVRASINKANSDDPAVVDSCPFFLCGQNETFIANNAGTPSSTIRNNTGSVVTGFKFEFLEDQDGIWVDNGSDIFDTVEISPNGRKISFSDGFIPVGDATIITTESGEEVFSFSVEIDAQEVPESSSAIGILIASTFLLLGKSKLSKRPQTV